MHQDQQFLKPGYVSASLIFISLCLQIKSQELFDEWVSKLRHHRLYRQNEIAMFPHEKTLFHPHYSPTSSPPTPDTQSIRKVCQTEKNYQLTHFMG